MTDELKNYNGFMCLKRKKVAIKSVASEIKPETMQNSTHPPSIIEPIIEGGRVLS